MSNLKKFGEFGEAIEVAISEECARREHALLERIGTPCEKAMTIKNKMDEILAKEFITSKEAAFMLNCSESHIRKLINLAKSGEDSNPIPYTPLGSDLTVIHTKSLLEWALPQKRTLDELPEKSCGKSPYLNTLRSV